MQKIFLILLLYLLLVDGSGKPGTPKPCCFPFSFQATVADLRSYSPENVRLYEIYRDWDRRLQVQKVVAFVAPGQTVPVATILMDFKKSTKFLVSATGDCEIQPLDFAMLEPCIPGDAKYLGQTYLGFAANKTNVHSWAFKRTDQGRNISMTVSVTTDFCVPVMESISGTLGQAHTDLLAVFTTFQDDIRDHSVFDIPPTCASIDQM